MRLTRRDLLRLAGGAAVVLPLAVGCTTGDTGDSREGGADGARSDRDGNPIDTVGRVAFDQPLAIPPLATARVDAAGRRVFDLTVQAGHSRFRPDRPTPTWGINGAYLGPTLRARRGQTVAVNVHNRLDEATTLHWHGMHLPARDDGGPHQMVEPGATWAPSWRITQPAATLWYHPHPHGRTEMHVYRGLAGMFIVDDDIEAALGLPRAYGVDDIPVIVQDKRFGRDGRLVEDVYGDTLVVNGTLGPYLTVTTEQVRLRLLNASTARVYAFGLSDNRSFALVATDGGLLTAPFRTDRIQLSPAERAEIVVSLRPGERVVLRSYPPDLGTDGAMTRAAGGADSFDVLELRAAPHLTGGSPLPARLVDIPRLDPASAATTRRFDLFGVQINGKSMDVNRIDEVVSVDTTEIWEVTNRDAQPHNFHVHDRQFQVLSVNGAAPPPQLAGWKDTVYVPPGTTVRIVMRFADYVDPAMPYMYHCHLLMHEDSGMMGQFVVVRPGQHPSGVDSSGGHRH